LAIMKAWCASTVAHSNPFSMKAQCPNVAWKRITGIGTRLERIAERKIRRRQLTDDGNIEITGRDLREREHRAPAGQSAFEWATR